MYPAARPGGLKRHAGSRTAGNENGIRRFAPWRMVVSNRNVSILRFAQDDGRGRYVIPGGGAAGAEGSSPALTNASPLRFG